jgi:hypothetical protein
MQQKLENFFQITTKYNDIYKKCFIYDPDLKQASFQYKPETSDQFVTTKCNVKLFYKPSKTTQPIIHSATEKINTSLTIPILKSNLQKAVRRGNINAALTTAAALLEKDCIEFLRRLPIIFVEDVCLFDSFPIIVWLMMSDKEYKLTNTDKHIILSIVQQLCVTQLYFDYEPIEWTPEFTNISVKDIQHSDELLAMYYRSLYGGMPCDIQLLQTAIHYYRVNLDKIVKTNFEPIHLEGVGVELLAEAIDFHPFPHILQSIKNVIEKQEQIRNVKVEDIKTCIWFSESAANIRKPYTQAMSEKYKQTNLWTNIKPELNKLRRKIIAQYDD